MSVKIGPIHKSYSSMYLIYSSIFDFNFYYSMHAMKTSTSILIIIFCKIKYKLQQTP